VPSVSLVVGGLLGSKVRRTNQLSAVSIGKLAPGRYCDGAGLWLYVPSKNSRSWILRYMRKGVAREMGLGPADLVSLKEARRKAHDARRLLLEDVRPYRGAKGLTGRR
jgi:hypothetical protein